MLQKGACLTKRGTKLLEVDILGSLPSEVQHSELLGSRGETHLRLTCLPKERRLLGDSLGETKTGIELVEK